MNNVLIIFWYFSTIDLSFYLNAIKEDFMELKEYFAVCSRETAVRLKIDSPSLKPLTSGKKRTQTGISATFKQEDFSFSIFYIESGKGAYAQQTLWLSFVIDREPLVVFSVYDVLAFLHPEDFNCYTYTYVDSEELMKNCFRELEQLLARLLPEFAELCGDGVKKNTLISSQKQKLNDYFGDPILESGEMLGGRADKLIAMMLFNFFQYQIESAVIGNQALFYKGKTEKALKNLKKAKYRSAYDDNLLRFLERGGKAPEQSETVKNASAKKGASRHGGDAKGAFKFFLQAVLYTIPVAAVCVLLFLALVFLFSRDAFFVSGIKENLVFLPFCGILMGFTVALNILARKEPKRKSRKDIQKPPLPQAAKTLLKYYTIAVETLTIVLVLTSVNSTSAFFRDGFSYSTDDFPLSKSYCEYSSVDYAAVVEGYLYEGEFTEDPHIVFVTKSGEKLDLYNSTFFSAERFEKEASPILKEKGIETKHFKTLE